MGDITVPGIIKNQNYFACCDEEEGEKMRKHMLIAFVVAGLISSVAVTDYFSAVTEPVEVKPKVTVEAETEPDPEPVKEEPVEETFWMDLGTFEITAYCTGTCCSSGTGITASGTVATVGRTIGVDPDLIPLGSTVKILFEDGTEHTFIAEDTGSATKGNIIDLLLDSHEEALQFGRQTCQVFIEEVNEARN